MILSVDFFDRAQRACTIDAHGGLRIWDTHTGESLAECDFDGTNICDLDIASDDRSLAVVVGRRQGSATIRLFDLADPTSIRRQPLWRHELPAGFWRGIEFSPDCKHVAYCTGTEVHVREVRTGRQVATFQSLDTPTISIRFSRDGERLACATGGGSTYILQASDYHLVRHFRSDEGGTYCADFSPDGRTLITGGEDNVIKKWDAATFEPLGEFSPCTNAVACLRYSPDGTRVLSTTVDGTVHIWRSETGTSVFQARDRISNICVNLAMSRDGLTFASGVDVMRVWRVPQRSTEFGELRVSK